MAERKVKIYCNKKKYHEELLKDIIDYKRKFIQ